MSEKQAEKIDRDSVYHKFCWHLKTHFILPRIINEFIEKNIQQFGI